MSPGDSCGSPYLAATGFHAWTNVALAEPACPSALTALL